MDGFRGNFARGLGAALLLVLLAGCEGLHPYRTSRPEAGLICDPAVEGGFPERCKTQIHERGRDYDLFFAEFTDQGLQYPSQNPEWGEAAYQIDRTLEGLNEIAGRHKGVSIITFVHGWQHNASHDDGNVESFRALLRSAAALEEARGSGYRVVGVYVGWRGRSLKGGLLSNLSFWSRKATALRVAQGSPRELFNRLRGFKCAQNSAQSRVPDRTGDLEACTGSADGSRPRVRLLMIGHSFGGWILYNAVAGSLIESLTHASDTGGSNGVHTRYADMVVLLNPAFEASRYTPLHRVAVSPHAGYRRYQAPLLVSVTSGADRATGWAFPAGRFINTLLEREAGDEERVATKYTMGHMTDGDETNYITHTLTTTPVIPAGCQGWEPLSGILDAERREAQARTNLRAEEENTDHFPGTRRALEKGWQRTFCGGAQLSHTNHDPNSVIWNVHTDETIMGGHNDIENPKLIDFLRQLYHDALRYPHLAVSDAGSPAPPASGAPAAPPGAATVGGATARR